MPPRRFLQVDVFSAEALKGNPLAVVVDGAGLSAAAMQGFARWTNLAETAFLTPPTRADADYAVRIFTPAREMPFAGHPTLGSCMAWLDAGGVPATPGVVRQECGVGVVEVDVSGPVPAFAAPPTRVSPMRAEERARIMDRLGLRESQVIATAELENGPVWQAFELDAPETVLGLDAARVRWPEFKAIGLIARDRAAGPDRWEARMLAPSSGMSEDPITGSLNAALACWFRDRGLLDAPRVVAQGTAIGRLGRVAVTPRADGRVLIGGAVHVVVRGEVEIPG